MMTNKPPYRPRTILDDGEPLSEEERQLLARTERERWLEEDAEKWAEDRLSEIYHLAKHNKNIALALCKTAANCASGNTELTNFIKEKLKRSSGRPKNSAPNALLLTRYALEMLNSEGNHEVARKSLIDYIHHHQQGYPLSDESMENQITKAINEVRQGKILLSELIYWAQPIIQERMDRGTKTGARKAEESKP